MVMAFEYTGYSMTRSSLASGSGVVSLPLAISVLSSPSSPVHFTSCKVDSGTPRRMKTAYVDSEGRAYHNLGTMTRRPQGPLRRRPKRPKRPGHSAGARQGAFGRRKTGSGRGAAGCPDKLISKKRCRKVTKTVSRWAEQ
jgi:hypothetical protein